MHGNHWSLLRRLTCLAAIILPCLVGAGTEIDAGEINGMKWNDLNANGVRDAGEPGLAGWDIRISGPVGGDHSTLTDPNGAYSFSNLASDTYLVFEVAQAGWSQSFPPASGTYSIQLAASDVVSGIDFGNWQEPTGEISGTKWNDLNANGTRDAGEPGIPGWTIWIVVDSNLLTTTTDQDGRYWFLDVPPGTYGLAEQQQAGWIQTFPPSPGTHVVEVQPGEIVANVDFGNWQATPGEIHGTKWNDLNADGDRDAGEPGIPGWVIRLDSGDGIVTTTTDDNGEYWFVDLPPSRYELDEESQAGWSQSFPPPPGKHVVQLSAGEVIHGIDFGNWQSSLGEIHGSKWDDLNGNGRWDVGEDGVAGWTIRLDDGTHISTTSTDPDGAYRFRDLAPGGYQVSESQLPGWVQTFPPAGVHDVAVGPSEVIAGVDFGNFSQLGSGSGSVDSLRVDFSQGTLVLTWGPSCLDSDVDYAVYEGDLGDWTSHRRLQCSTDSVAMLAFSPPSGSTYYLVVPRNFVYEGSYGDSQPGLERPQAVSSCATQSVSPCP